MTLNSMFTILLWATVLTGCTPHTDTTDDNSTNTAQRRTLLTDFASFRDGSDWAPAFAKAFEQADTVIIPAGTYSCSEVVVPSGKTIRGAGSRTTLEPLSERLIVIQGKKATAEIPISADIADFSNVIALTSTDNLASDDDIMIIGQRNSILQEGTDKLNYDSDWVLGRTRQKSCFYGEFDMIEKVESGRVVTRNGRIFPHYYKNSAREPAPMGNGYSERKSTAIIKIDMVHDVTLSDFAIVGTSSCNTPVKIAYAKDCHVERIAYRSSVETFNSSGKTNLTVIHLNFALRVEVTGCSAEFSQSLIKVMNSKEKTYANYTVYNIFKAISCTECGFDNCTSNWGSHAFSITYTGSGTGGIPSIGCYIRNCSASNCIWSGVTVQQGCYRTTLSGNVVDNSGQGVACAGRCNTISNNTLTCGLPYSTDYYYTHINRGGTMGIAMIEGFGVDATIENNTICGYYTAIAIRDGYEEKNIYQQGNFTVKDNRIGDCLTGFGIYRNKYNTGTVALNTVLSHNEFFHSGLRTMEIAGKQRTTVGVFIPDSTGHIEVIDNSISGFACGVLMEGAVDYINVTDNAFTDCNYGIELSGAGDATVHLHHRGNTFTNVNTTLSGIDSIVDF